MFGTGVYIATALLALLGFFVAMQPYVHHFQLNSYKARPFIAEQLRSGKLRGTAMALAAASLSGCFGLAWAGLKGIQWPAAVGACIGLALGASVIVVFFSGKPAKKPLAYTPRVWRLFALGLTFPALGLTAIPVFDLPGYWAMLLALPLLWMDVYISFVNLLLTPLEEHFRKGFKKKAVAKLRANPDRVIIGITGSFGKTSTKMFLKTLLSQKFSCYATPASFNTPLGVCRAINEELKPEHTHFICEMGARQAGDIKELCELVSPKHGIITAIGAAHLETMGSLEGVAAAKGELLDGLAEDGVAVLPADGGMGQALAEKRDNCLLFGTADAANVRAFGITAGPTGSDFSLIFGGEIVSAHTALLGAHNVENLAAAAAMAWKLGMTPDEIAAAIALVEPVEHRLQVVRNDTITVIDDAFNANPAGVRAAMAVLAQFPGRKIVITPGLVEMGDREEAENEAVGELLAATADVVLLVGKSPRTNAIVKGFREVEDEKRLVRMDDLAEATAWIAQNSAAGDVILFENDLPDNFS